jgi:MarR family transcriptional regulator, transcriptional regulator for hemolysin
MNVRRGAAKASRTIHKTRRPRKRPLKSTRGEGPEKIIKLGLLANDPDEISRCFYEWVPEGVAVGSVEDKKLRLTRRILFLSRRWLNMIDGVLRVTGDSHARWVTLLWVGMLDGKGNIGELADQIGVELPTLVRLLNRLEREGLVERRSLAGSNRAKTVVLTAKGRRESAVMNDIVDRARADFVRGVNEEQLTATIDLLDSLISKYARVVMWSRDSRPL